MDGDGGMGHDTSTGTSTGRDDGGAVRDGVVRDGGQPHAAGGGWATYLDPGERLIWEGAPAGGIRIEGHMIAQSIFGIFFFGFAVFWIWGASSIGSQAPGPFMLFPLFGLPFVAIGAWMLFGHILWDAYRRTKTRYALTNKRAFIARAALGRSLKSWPVDEDTELDYRPGERATIYFAKDVRYHRTKNGGRRTSITPVGFRWIEDGDRVYRLFREVQRGEA